MASLQAVRIGSAAMLFGPGAYVCALANTRIAVHALVADDGDLGGRAVLRHVQQRGNGRGVALCARAQRLAAELAGCSRPAVEPASLSR